MARRRDDSNAIKTLGFEFFPSYTALAAVPARFALERLAWKKAAVLEPRGSQFPQAEAITYFARAIGSARSGDLATADRGVDKLNELRAALEKANQSYWAEQVEIQMLAASAWIAHAKGEKEEALKFMRAAADVEDNSEKHTLLGGYDGPEILRSSSCQICLTGAEAGQVPKKVHGGENAD